MPISCRRRRTSAAGSAVSSTSSSHTLPEVGRSSRLMQRTSVDFPAPEKPMTPKISPSLTLRLTLSTAVTIFLPD